MSNEAEQAKALRDQMMKRQEESSVRISFVLDGTCKTCSQLAKGEMCPPHDASPRCLSGKRNHCSCDICS